jgi:hypothetical protein
MPVASEGQPSAENSEPMPLEYRTPVEKEILATPVETVGSVEPVASAMTRSVEIGAVYIWKPLWNLYLVGEYVSLNRLL